MIDRKPHFTLIIAAILMLGAGCSSEDPAITFDGEVYSLATAEGDDRVFRASGGDTQLRVVSVEEESWDYAVYIENGTTAEEYYLSGSARNYAVKFPDGRTLTRRHQDSSTSGSSEPGIQTSFADWNRVDDLGELVYGAPEPQPSSDSASGLRFAAGLLLIGGGLVSVINPHLAFFLQLGWKMKDSEPSDAFLGVTRAFGVITIVIGMVVVLS